MFRVYSGTFKANSSVYNPIKEKDERIGALFTMVGKKQLPTDQVAAGDIGAVTKLLLTTTNDTLCDRSQPVILKQIKFPFPCLSSFFLSLKVRKTTCPAPSLKMKIRFLKWSTMPKPAKWSYPCEQQLDVLRSKLKAKFNVDATLEEPRVAYRETIRKKVRVQGRHKKQTGGHGQYGDVWIEFEPGEEEGLTFEEKIFGGSVPKSYHPAVEKGLQEAIQKGVLAVIPWSISRPLWLMDPITMWTHRKLPLNWRHAWPTKRVASGRTGFARTDQLIEVHIPEAF